jgi:hypothetical protein
MIGPSLTDRVNVPFIASWAKSDCHRIRVTLPVNIACIDSASTWPHDYVRELIISRNGALVKIRYKSSNLLGSTLVFVTTALDHNRPLRQMKVRGVTDSVRQHYAFAFVFRWPTNLVQQESHLSLHAAPHLDSFIGGGYSRNWRRQRRCMFH